MTTNHGSSTVRRGAWRLITLFAVLAAIVTASPGLVAAKTLVVTDSGDGGKPGQLRTLVAEAADGDEIVIPDGMLIDLFEGQITITKKLTIRSATAGDNPASRLPVISGGFADRVFHIDGDVVLFGFDIVDGNPRAVAADADGGAILISKNGRLDLETVEIRNSGARSGGAIFCEGQLTASDVGLLRNTASDDGGGLVIAPTGTATVEFSLIEQNVAFRGGGGIANLGTLDLSTTSVVKNFGRTGGGLGVAQNARAVVRYSRFRENGAIQGGAINNTTNAVTEITSSVFVDNRAATSGPTAGLGGAVFNLGTITLTNTTLRRNSADAAGGGLFNAKGASATLAGTMKVVGSTIVDNSAIQTPSGGNAFNSDPGGLLTFKRSIISGGGCAGLGGISSEGFNMNSGNDCAGLSGPGDRTNVGPLKLAALGDYGGFTETMPPLPGSPAINAGGACTGTDARGVAQPQDGACEIGAVELQSIASAGVGVTFPPERTTFRPGDRLSINCSYVPGTSTSSRDYYCVGTRADLTAFASVVPGPNGFQVTFGSVPVPFARNATLAQEFTIDVVHDVTASDPGGTFFTAAATTAPGANPLTPTPDWSVDVAKFVIRNSVP